MPHLTPNLWFDDNALEAAEFYCSVFPNSKITTVLRHTQAELDAVPDELKDAGPGQPGSVLTVSFELDGQDITGINGGPMFQFSEAVSLLINCKDQAEIDYYWDALTADGGQESQCGWLKDKFGFSWQVVPEDWESWLLDPDEGRVNRMMTAMYAMQKLDIAALQAAADGVSA
jgi:predicted 3-demethylubiquinone-9 3-methyltransferase (glyoxalase superfamily)